MDLIHEKYLLTVTTMMFVTMSGKKRMVFLKQMLK